MTDRLDLAHAIETAGIDRKAAETIANTIFDAIRENVATKADLAELRAALEGDMDNIRAELKADIAAVRADLALVEHRLMTRLGGLVVVLLGLLFAALHLWPAHG